MAHAPSPRWCDITRCNSARRISPAFAEDNHGCQRDWAGQSTGDGPWRRGLEAIATAHRLGAIVEGYDVRPETQEQALSLGSTFVERDSWSALAEAHPQGSGRGDERRRHDCRSLRRRWRQLREHSTWRDDADRSGHDRGAAKTCRRCSARTPANASELYANNQYNLLVLMMKENVIRIDWDDEVLTKTFLTHAGDHGSTSRSGGADVGNIVLGRCRAAAVDGYPGARERTCGVCRRRVLTVRGLPGCRRGEDRRREHSGGNDLCRLLGCPGDGDGDDCRDRSVIRHGQMSSESQIRSVPPIERGCWSNRSTGSAFRSGMGASLHEFGSGVLSSFRACRANTAAPYISKGRVPAYDRARVAVSFGQRRLFRYRSGFVERPTSDQKGITQCWRSDRPSRVTLLRRATAGSGRSAISCSTTEAGRYVGWSSIPGSG